jgi:hypothetical protein
MSIMKKMLFLVVVVTLTSAWTGCNRGWGNCLCKQNDTECVASDACGYEQAACGCEGYTTRSPGAEYGVPSVPTPTAEPLQLPGPAANNPSAR